MQIGCMEGKMRGRLFWAAGTLILLAAMLVSTAWFLGEPRFQGRSLTSWITEYERTKSISSQTAIRAMGSNALPILMKKLNQTEPTVEDKIFGWIGKRRRYVTPRTMDQSRALSGLEAMGTNASVVIPDLMIMASHEETCALAINAMARIGTTAEQPFRKLLERSGENALRVLYSIEPGEEAIFNPFTQMSEEWLATLTNGLAEQMHGPVGHNSLFDPLKGPDGERWH
jgi:hypothetical protein